jgi:aminopeptidase N
VETSITVPAGYVAIANGRLQRRETRGNEVTFVYKAEQPSKYFSMLIARLNGDFTRDSIVPIHAFYYSIDKKAAEQFTQAADAILRFYSDYFGPYPYTNLNLVLRPIAEPGGHSPATTAIVNRVFTFLQIRFRKDPLYVPEFPTFILAHELAHQWWGQAVGWRTYQDQWLSEGFAQFAAWEYIRSVHGDKSGMQLGRTFFDWVEDKTYAGPIVLGVRLGHLTEDSTAFSALVYNKGAYVLYMLKNWMGEKAFTAALREFYSAYKFRLAAIEDFFDVAQRHSREDLSPFFRQWLFRWEIPSVTWTETRNRQDSSLVLTLRFSQPAENFYHLKIPVEVKSKDGQVLEFIAMLDQPEKELDFVIPFTPASVSIDPARENLMKASERNH